MYVRAIQRTRALSFVLSTCLMGCACGGKDHSLPQKPAPAYGIPHHRPTNTSTTLPGQKPEPNSYGDNHALGAEQHPRFEEPRSAPEQAPRSAPKQERDYSAELSALLSKSVPGCLASFRPSTASITIQVSAQVMASGIVSRAEAQAPGLTPPILACIKKLASSVQLNGPVVDAPRSVQTQITLQTQGAANVPQPKAAAEDNQDSERDGDPRDSKLHHVEDNPAEVEQRTDEPTREAPEPPDPKDESPADNHTD
jgi:hypothetical protein